MPGIPDLITILVILFIVFGATMLPRTGQAIGRWLARRQGKRPPT